MGIEFKLNTEVGRDVQLDDLLSDYDAVFLASGLISQCAAGWKTKTPMACTQRCRSYRQHQTVNGFGETNDEPFVSMEAETR